MNIPLIEITVPENLNRMIDEINHLPVPCSISINNIVIPIRTIGERNMFSFGVQTMWDILDDRMKKTNTVD